MAAHAEERCQRINLCGVGVEVRTTHAEFARYLEAQFPPGGALAVDGRSPDVVVRVRWTEGPRPSLAPQAVFPDWRVETRIDRHVHTGPRELVWTRVDDVPQIAVALRATETGRRFEVRYHFTLGEARRWREAAKRLLRWRRLPRLRRHRLSTLTYYAVYYPVWWHLEAERAAHPLHAAGVALRDRALVLAGLPGSGKSTLAASFLGLPDAELLADNLLIYDARLVYGCFEPLLLDADARAHLGTNGALEALGRRHPYAQRDAFHAPHRPGGVPLGAVVVVARGRATRLAPIAPAECARLLLAINEAAKEVRRYHVLAAVLGFLEPEALRRPPERAARLQRLVTGVPCYRLEVREGAPAEARAVLTDLMTPAEEAAP